MEPFLSKHKYGTTYININIKLLRSKWCKNNNWKNVSLDFDIKETLHLQTSNDRKGRHKELQVQLLKHDKHRTCAWL